MKSLTVLSDNIVYKVANIAYAPSTSAVFVSHYCYTLWGASQYSSCTSSSDFTITIDEICGYIPDVSFIKIRSNSNQVQCTDGWCASGTGWSTGDGAAINDIECTNAWSTECPAGQYLTPENNLEDRCLVCPSGQFQPNDNSDATSCTSWKTCGVEEFISYIGTVSADVSCAPWSDAFVDKNDASALAAAYQAISGCG